VDLLVVFGLGIRCLWIFIIRLIEALGFFRFLFLGLKKAPEFIQDQNTAHFSRLRLSKVAAPIFWILFPVTFGVF
jgi:hypothetical protein